MPEHSSEPGDGRLHAGDVVDGIEVIGSLSPSRANDFKTCPLYSADVVK